MADQKTFYINLFDAIDLNKVKNIMTVLTNIINQKKPELFYILFSSPGGQVDPGITLYNFIKSLPVEVIMHNTGSIDSIANIIFLSADKRYTSVHSSFLFHGIVHNVPVGSNYTKSQLQEIISGINISESKIAGIIAEQTKLTTEEIRNLFLQGETKDSKFALEKGIVSEILNPKIPDGVEIVSFNLQ
jgi:ATP-dependent Clp protease, protease subunit